ncbi:MAG: zinc ribbon domain-containing protein [Phycisphaerae bacterium]|nr:zinc ribbon domain-containing protein [Phycisphaerae bacterium]
MPIFEYRCNACGHVTSFLEKAGSKKKHACEKCGSGRTEKVFSTFSAKAGGSAGSSGASCPTGTCPLS